LIGTPVKINGDLCAIDRDYLTRSVNSRRNKYSCVKSTFNAYTAPGHRQLKSDSDARTFAAFAFKLKFLVRTLDLLAAVGVVTHVLECSFFKLIELTVMTSSSINEMLFSPGPVPAFKLLDCKLAASRHTVCKSWKVLLFGWAGFDRMGSCCSSRSGSSSIHRVVVIIIILHSQFVLTNDNVMACSLVVCCLCSRVQVHFGCDSSLPSICFCGIMSASSAMPGAFVLPTIGSSL
jgi:hypothetical protein